MKRKFYRSVIIAKEIEPVQPDVSDTGSYDGQPVDLRKKLKKYLIISLPTI
ncbi:hypothetical protein [Clostridium formicaceticum]|nr:hypothetical protein [Clostridium formicaceticum]